MTINFNQYEVGIVPQYGTTDTTTFCYTTPTTSRPSRSTTTTTSNVYNNALRQGLRQQEYNGFSSLHFVQSRARCRTPPAYPLVICPGERLPSVGALGAAAISNTSRIEAADSGKTTTSQRMEVWPECFQDLGTWCHPVRDELNTPQINIQDEFNFSLNGQANNCNNWGYEQSEFLGNTWENQDLLLESPNNEEENNNYPAEILANQMAYYSKADVCENLNKGVCIIEEPASSSVLKTKGNILLSQASLQLQPEESLPTAEGIFTDYNKLNSSQSARLGSGGKLIKNEEAEEFQVAVIEQVPIQQQLPVVERRVAVAGGKKPKLKLHIPQTPQTTKNETTGSLATPEVLKPFTDETAGFDLLSFINNGDGESTSKTESNISSTKDHDYTEPPKSAIKDNLYIKSEPMSPSSVVTLKRHLTLDDSEYDSDPSGIMDDDSESEEWFPTVGTDGRKASRRRRKLSVDSFDGQDKYRALRDRNNEASRRSRLNRKQRDNEMRSQESDLARRNIELKVKAERMEKLVKVMQAAILNSIKSSRNNSIP